MPSGCLWWGGWGRYTQEHAKEESHGSLSKNVISLMHWCAAMCWAVCLRTACSILFILVTFPCLCWVRSFSPFYSLSLSLEICSCISATISGFWHRKVQLNDHNAWNRTPTSHTFLIRFPVESWSFISNANWNCCHNHTDIVLGSGLIHYHCLNVLIGNLWEFFFSFLCTLPLGRRLGWRALGEVYWYEEQDGYIL